MAKKTNEVIDEALPPETKDVGSTYGFSRKTNIAIAGIAGIASAQSSWIAIVAITGIVILALTYQFNLDKEKK